MRACCAVKATKEREAAAERDDDEPSGKRGKGAAQGSDSGGDSEGDDGGRDADGSNQVYGGTVSFVDGTKTMTAKRAKKKKDSQKVRDAKKSLAAQEDAPAKAPHKHLEAGALAHSGSSNVPGASRSQVFGAEHAKNFQELGISKVCALLSPREHTSRAHRSSGSSAKASAAVARRFP